MPEDGEWGARARKAKEEAAAKAKEERAATKAADEAECKKFADSAEAKAKRVQAAKEKLQEAVKRATANFQAEVKGDSEALLEVGLKVEPQIKEEIKQEE